MKTSKNVGISKDIRAADGYVATGRSLLRVLTTWDATTREYINCYGSIEVTPSEESENVIFHSLEWL